MGRFGHQRGPFWTQTMGRFGSWAVLVISHIIYLIKICPLKYDTIFIIIIYFTFFFSFFFLYMYNNFF